MVNEGDLLWTPGAARKERAQITAFLRWLERERDLKFQTYEALWQWSVTDLDAFWRAIWNYFGVRSSAPFTRVLGRRAMPGAEWFPGARLNYAQHALAHERQGVDALIYGSEQAPLARMSWTELGSRVRI